MAVIFFKKPILAFQKYKTALPDQMISVSVYPDF